MSNLNQTTKVVILNNSPQDNIGQILFKNQSVGIAGLYSRIRASFTSNKNMPDTLPNLIMQPKKIPVKIQCPECRQVQDAQVELTFPFHTYIHTCEKCKYVIMESEWMEVKIVTNV